MDKRNDSNPVSGEVTRLVERYLTLQRDGASVNIEKLCENSPQIADQVKREINALNVMNRLYVSALDSTDHNEEPGNSAPIPTVKLGQKTGSAFASTEYEISRFHAHGGSSEVYVANDKHLGRTVAIKFLRPDTENERAFQLRLKREAKITSRLDHPGVVSIHASGTDDRGLPFYTMRFVDGNSFRADIEMLHRNPNPMSHPIFRILLKHFVAVCQTVAYAHSRNVIHRDIKPENIVTGDFGETYLVDWGLAQHLSSSPDHGVPNSATAIDQTDDSESLTTDGNSERLTQLGNTIGTPAYMSPEQASAAPITRSSDIFNLGATLYTLLTGVPPYSNPSILKTLDNAQHAHYRPVRDLNQNVARPLAAICQKAMSFSTHGRYESATELANDLEQYLADEPVVAFPDRFQDITRRWVRKHRTLVTTVITTLIAAILILTIATQLLLETNRQLANRESEANFHKKEARESLEVATQNLAAQQIALAESEIKKNNVVRATELLDRCPAKYRGVEWHLLTALVNENQPLMTIPTDGNVIRGFDFSPDGSVLAVGHSGGKILLLNIKRDSEFGRFEVLDELDDGMEIWHVAYSPDGKRLLTAGKEIFEGRMRGAIHLWDMDSKTIVRKRWGHGRLVHSVDWSSDGTRIATGGNVGGVRIRHSATLEPVLRINKAHDGPIRSIRFSGNSPARVVTAGDDGTIKTWASDGTLETTQSRHQHGVSSLVVHDDHLFSAGNDNLIRRSLNDSARRPGPESNLDQVFVGHQDNVETIAISPDGQFLVSGGFDRNLRIWNAETGAPVKTIRSHTSHIRKVGFGGKGELLVSAGDDGGVKIWETERLFQRLPGGESVHFLAASNRLVAVSPQLYSIWDADDNRPVLRKQPERSPYSNVVTSHQSDSFACLHLSGRVSFYDATGTGKPRMMFQNKSACFAAEFTRDDSHLVVAHVDGTIEVWNPRTGRLDRSVNTNQRITGLALTANQETLVTSSWFDGSLVFLDFETLENSMKVAAHPHQVLDVVAHPKKHRVVTTGHDGVVKTWDAANGDCLETIRFGASWLNCIAFTADGKRMVTGSEHTIVFWDTETKREVLSMSVDRCVHSISFSADGSFMAVAGEDPQIRIWQVGPPNATTQNR